jgi:hypothetical protein
MNPVASRTEATFAGAVVGTGLGVITLALFPFALPIVILTIVAILPLLLPVILLAVGGAIVAALWIGLRHVGRAVRRLRRSGGGDAAREGATIAVPAHETPTVG